MKNNEPFLSYDTLAKTVYIVFGKEKCAVEESQLRAIIAVLDAAKGEKGK